MIRGQVDENGNPRSRAETLDMMLTNGDFDRISEVQIKTLGLDPTNPEHAFAIQSIRGAGDEMAQQAIRARAQQNSEAGKRTALHTGTLTPGGATEAWKAGAMGTGSATGESVSMLQAQWAATGSEIPFKDLGVSPGQPIDYDKVMEVGGEKAIAMIAGAEAQLWGRNSGVDLPAEAGKQLVAMMRDGSTGKRLAAQNFFDQLPPGQSDRLLGTLAVRDRAYARAVVYADDLQVTPEALSQQLQRIDEFKSAGDARQIQRFMDGSSEATFKDLRDTTQDAIKAIATPFGGRAEAQVALGNDNMTSYFFDRVFETAMAANGGVAPSADNLQAASMIVYGEFEDQGFSLVTVGSGTRFVSDRFKHTNPQMGPVETYDLQLAGEMDLETAQAVMSAVGLSWDADTPPANTRAFMQGIAIEMAGSNEFAKADITFRPVSPGSPWWDAFANSPSGGVAMIPFANVGGSMVPMVTPDQVEQWPFISSQRLITADLEAMEQAKLERRQRTQEFQATIMPTNAAGAENARVAGPNYRRFGGSGPRAATAQPKS